MLETIKSVDESLFLCLNAHHNSIFDQVMWLFSTKFFWAPLYAWFLWLLFKKYPRKYWTVLITVALMIVASDQLCNFSKESIMRLRPSHEPRLESLIHIVNNYRGGMYGFYSGHAANAFAVAFFIISSLAGKRKYLVPVAFLYAILTAYSRIYLGVHYPGDILTGAIAGALLGTGFAIAHNLFREKILKLT